jgi:hypothetical protein
MAEQGPGAPGAQDVAVVDRIRPERHRLQQRADLATRPGSAGAIAKLDGPIDQPLEAEPLDQGARQQHARVGDQPLVVELDRHRIGAHQGPRTVHHVGDLLTPGRRCSNQPLFACSGGHFRGGAGRIRGAVRWIEA